MNGAALGGGYEIALACHHRVALDAPGYEDRLPRGHPRPAARRRRRRPYGTPAGHRRRTAEGAAPGHPVQPPARPEERPDRRSGRHPGRVAGQGPRLHRRQPRVAAALGQARLPHPGRHPGQPQVRGEPARLPGQPAQADERRALPGPAQHPRGGRRGRPGRLRDRAGHRGPLLRRTGRRTDLEEHDPGVLLRPPGRQLRRQPPQGRRAAPGAQGGGPRRRDDGRGHRLLVRPRGHRRRPQGRLGRSGRPGQELLREAVREGRLPGTLRPRRRRTRCWPASRRPPIRRTWPAATRSSRRSSRTRP